MGQRHAPAAFYPRERYGTLCTGGWLGPRPVWKGAKNLAPTTIRSPDRQARNQSLYRLSLSRNFPLPRERNKLRAETRRSSCINPLRPELNPSAQRCMPRFFTGILICKGLTDRRLYKSFGVKGLIYLCAALKDLHQSVKKNP
jgi:hypothetical protein